MSHAPFILASYFAVVLVVGGLIGWVWWRHRHLSRALARIDPQQGSSR